MIEKVIYLDAVDPLDIYGVNDSKLKKIKSYFPKLKIVARGNEIKSMGNEEDINRFEEKILLLIDYFNLYNNLTDNDIDRLMADNGKKLLNSEKKSEGILIHGSSGKPIQARTVNQRIMVNKYDNNDLLFSIGPAGTGKTYISIALAVRALRNKEVKRIILSRPAVEAGEHLGYLPGDLKEKLDPYLQPLYDSLFDMIPGRRLENYFEDGTIQIAPLAFMRGRTLNNAFVILDEAQNATINQIKMFLTRMGENSKFILTGDITQIDLPDRDSSGLLLAMRILKNIKGISFIFFDERDIVRHKLVKDIVDAYEKKEK